MTELDRGGGGTKWWRQDTRLVMLRKILRDRSSLRLDWRCVTRLMHWTGERSHRFESRFESWQIHHFIELIFSLWLSWHNGCETRVCCVPCGCVWLKGLPELLAICRRKCCVKTRTASQLTCGLAVRYSFMSTWSVLFCLCIYCWFSV